MEHHTDSPSVSMGDKTATPIKNTSAIVNCPHRPISPVPIPMDEDGDLHLVVGENKCLLPWMESESDSESDNGSTRQSEADTATRYPEYLDEPHEHTQACTYIVCSKTLSRVSRIWKRLLYGGFAESEKPEDGTQWTVHLPEDDPWPMQFILSITHSCFYHVIPRIERFHLEDMYMVTVLTDKYDLTRIVRPWACGWTQRTWCFLNSEREWIAALNSLVQCLWVAWELGDQASFKLALQLIAHNTTLSEDGKLESHRSLNGDALLFKTLMEPPGADGKISGIPHLYQNVDLLTPALDLIRAHRTKCLDFILDPFRRALEKPFDYDGTPFTCRLHCGSRRRRECQAMLIGSIIQLLGNCDVWPICETALYLGTPEDLRQRLSAESVRVIQGKKHNKCVKLCFTELGMDLPRMPELPVLKDFQEAYLVAQSEKSGVSSGERAPAGELAGDNDLFRDWIVW